VRHQWQRQADETTVGIGVEWPAAELDSVLAVDALMVVTVVHGWTGDAGAGAAAAGIDDGMVSTASKAGAGEP
jgi:hypothetical protein